MPSAVTASDAYVAAEWPPPRSGTTRRSSVPQGLAQFMRPVLPVLTVEITAEVQSRIAEYGRDPDGIALTSTRLVITEALRYFVDHVEDPSAPRDELDETLRRLGRGVAYAGRSLESLRSAYHIGAGLGWRRIHAMATRQGLPAHVLGDLGEELFEFIDSLAAQSTLGYYEAQAQLTDAAHQWRGRVLELILAGTSAPNGELAANAAAGGWTIPERVALVAVRPVAGEPMPSARMLHTRALATLHADEPIILLPAPVSPELRAEITTLFSGHRLAIGCEVPVGDAATSLRWARRALELAAVGAIPDGPVIDCRDHVGTLWIHAEPLFAEIVVKSTLAPLFDEPRNSRRILGLTLLHWISTQNPSAPAMAEALGVHPQTVRYRLKRLREIFGDRIDDPSARLEMFFALRATGPQWNDGQPAPS
jgi:hypothetical protein